MNECALALPSAFVGLPDWRVIQWLKWPFVKAWEIGAWYLSWPFDWWLWNLLLWWCVVSVIFGVWWAWMGAELLFGPRQEDDDEEPPPR